MRIAPWLAVILLPVVVPAWAAAEPPEKVVVREELFLDKDEVQYRYAHRYSGNLSREIREHVDDDHGNGDGRVDAAEARRFADDHYTTYREDSGACLGRTGATLDGAIPTDWAFRSHRLGGAEGPVATGAPVEVSVISHFRFPAANATRVAASVRFFFFEPFFADCVTPVQNYTKPFAGVEHTPWDTAQSATRDEGAPLALLRVHPRGNASFERNSLTPTSYRGLWDGRGWTVDDEKDSAWFFGMATLNFTVLDPAPPPDATLLADLPPATPWIALGTLIALLLAFLLKFEGARIALGRAALVGGFTRLEQDQVLANGRREELLQRIRESPGVCFSDLRRQSEMPNGPLVYHLRVLESRGHLKALRDGLRTRYYPRIPGATFALPLTGPQQELLDAVQRKPGLAQRFLARELGWSRLAVHRHAKNLVRTLHLRVERHGRERRYFPGAGTSVSAPPDTAVLNL